MARLYGYVGKTLRIDLSSGRATIVPTTDYSDRFIGGMGIASKIYWDETKPEVKALDPENRLLFVTGPVAGLPGLAGSIWQVHGKSPLTTPEHFSYGNLAGSWGAHLKFAGYDAMVVHGKSDKPVCLVVEDGSSYLKDASGLWGRSTTETREILKSEYGKRARVACIGPAGENGVIFANIMAEDDSSASGGLGAVMGSKNLKAVVVKGYQRPVAADPERLREIAARVRELKEGARQGDFGFLPGPHMKKQACYGCISGCIRAVMKAANGRQGKYMCQSGIFYQYRAMRHYREWNEVPFYANRICDEYGVDTRVMETMLAWLTRCHKAGILTDENTGLPLSKFGSLEFIEALVKKISLRDGFGNVLAGGTIHAADAVGSDAVTLLTDYIFHTTGQAFEGDPRKDIVTGLLYSMQPRQHAVSSELAGLIGKWNEWVRGVEGAYVSPQVLKAISRRLFGDEKAVDFSTYEGKGHAAKIVQDRWSARESLILCAFAWPIIDAVNSEDHIGDPTLESQVFSAVTGKEMNQESLSEMGEVIFNLRHAIFAREGRKGRDSDVIPEVFYRRPLKDRIKPEDPCFVPGRDGQPIPRKGAVVDREAYEKIKDDYYQARGWDVATGLQTRRKLNELGLPEVAIDLGRRGLAI